MNREMNDFYDQCWYDDIQEVEFLQKLKEPEKWQSPPETQLSARSLRLVRKDGLKKAIKEVEKKIEEIKKRRAIFELYYSPDWP